MKDRIKQYIEHKGISAGELAVMLDVQRSNISHILNGRNKPGASFIEKLLLTFPDLNARWLLTGAGEMLEAAGDQAEKTIPSTTLSFESTPSEIKQEDKKPDVEKVAIEDMPTIGDKEEDNVDRMVLLYRDGTFSTFKKRKTTS